MKKQISYKRKSYYVYVTVNVLIQEMHARTGRNTSNFSLK